MSDSAMIEIPRLEANKRSVVPVKTGLRVTTASVIPLENGIQVKMDGDGPRFSPG
jgi:hypothetical protein